MTPEQIGALRALLARATAAGWHLWYAQTFADGMRMREYWHDADLVEYSSAQPGSRGARILIRPKAGRYWDAPVISVTQIATVLELAGVIPQSHQVPAGEIQ